MMKLRRFVLVGALAGGASLTLRASTPLFENFGTLTNVPQLDTTAFANYGDFNVNTLIPYETQNTLYFTNTGRMIGNPGFRFENITANSVRTPAASFFNGLDARIAANDAGRFLPGTVLTNFGLGFENSQIFISATNVFMPPGPDHEIDCLCRPTRKNYFFAQLGIDKFLDLVPRALI